MTACSQRIKGTSPDSKSQEDKKQRVSKGAISDFHPWSKSNTFKARKRLNENQIEQALKEHLSQHSSQETDKLASVSKRLPVGTPKSDDTPNRPYLDEDLLVKVLEYLNQEKAEKGREHIAKRAMENM